MENRKTSYWSRAPLLTLRMTPDSRRRAPSKGARGGMAGHRASHAKVITGGRGPKNSRKRFQVEVSGALRFRTSAWGDETRKIPGIHREKLPKRSTSQAHPELGGDTREPMDGSPLMSEVLSLSSANRASKGWNVEESIRIGWKGIHHEKTSGRRAWQDRPEIGGRRAEQTLQPREFISGDRDSKDGSCRRSRCGCFGVLEEGNSLRKQEFPE